MHSSFQKQRHHVLFLGLGAVLCLVILSPVLIFSYVYGGGDLTNFQYPAWHTLWQSLRGNGSIAWDALRMGGFPLAIGQYGGLADPVNTILFSLPDFFAAYHMRVFLDLFLAFALAYVCFWRFTKSGFAAALGASAYAFSQFSWLNLPTFKFGNILFLLPMNFIVIDAVAAIKSRRAFALAAVSGGTAMGWALAGGDIQIFIWITLCSAIFAAHHVGRARAVPAFLVSLAIGLILNARQILASLHFSAFTARHLGIRFAEATADAMTPLHLIQFLIPHLSIPYVLSGPHSIFFGITALLFAAIAVLSWKRLERIGKFFVLLAGISFISMLKYSPIFWLLHQMPVLNMLRGSFSFAPLLVFADSALCAYGYKMLVESAAHAGIAMKLRRLKTVSRYALLACLAGNAAFFLFRERIAASLFNYLSSVHAFSRLNELGAAYYQRLVERMVANVMANISFAEPAFLLSGGALIVTLWALEKYVTNAVSRAVFSLTVLAALLGNLVPLLVIRTPYIAKADIETQPPTVAAVRHKADGGPFRVFSFLPGASEYEKLTVPFGYEPKESFAFLSALFYPATHALYGLASIDGYESFMPLRNARLLAELGSERATSGDLLAARGISLEEKKRVFLSHLNALGMLNVRYVASAYALRDHRLVLIGEYPVTANRIPVYLYQLIPSLPQAFLVPEARFVKNETDAFRAALDSYADFSAVAVIECSTCDNQVADGAGAADGVLRTVAANPTLFEFETIMNQPQWLVFGQNNLPGWNAELDGAVVPRYAANYVFQAVHVPAGVHRVMFRYDGTPINWP